MGAFSEKVSRFLDHRVAPYARPDFSPRPLPASFTGTLARAPLTVGAASLIVALHAGRAFSPAMARLYEASAFAPADQTWAGILFCGLFHESAGHFAANLVSFVPCVAILELAAGTRLAFLALGAGLWLSNPVAALCLRPLLAALSPPHLANFLAEHDYGASNGIYAVIGATAALLARPGQLIKPFIFNGLLFAAATSQWLAAQHLVALFLGYGIAIRALPRAPARPASMARTLLAQAADRRPIQAARDHPMRPESAATSTAAPNATL